MGSRQCCGSFLEKVAISMGGRGGWPAANIAWVTTLPSPALPIWQETQRVERTSGSRKSRMPRSCFWLAVFLRQLNSACSPNHLEEGPWQPAQLTPSSLSRPPKSALAARLPMAWQLRHPVSCLVTSCPRISLILLPRGPTSTA